MLGYSEFREYPRVVLLVAYIAIVLFDQGSPVLSKLQVSPLCA